MLFIWEDYFKISGNKDSSDFKSAFVPEAVDSVSMFSFLPIIFSLGVYTFFTGEQFMNSYERSFIPVKNNQNFSSLMTFIV